VIITLIIFILTSIILSIDDIRFFHIPLLLLYLGLLLMIISSFIFYRTLVCSSLIGMVLMPLFFCVVNCLSKKSIGLGDFQYSILCGFISGKNHFINTCILFSILVLVFYFVGKKRYIKNLRIPLVPYMFAGTIMNFLIVRFYTDYFIVS
jgi:prepilin signal peptidase PulO-like enzyme (type II secretory pathway)